ncbi:MAG: hypothetical protein M3P30_00265 [Chloroflexota bacterium]|nr:hypothetical protein [Chloroflexota bacterium]
MKFSPRAGGYAIAMGALLLLGACGGGTSSAGITPATGTSTDRPATRAAGGSSGGSGFLIITEPDGLAQYDIKSGSLKPLITPSEPNAYMLDPAVSADNASIAYVVQPPPVVNGTKYDAGSDLWVANRDGSGQHAVFTHDTPNQLVRFPQWEDAGHILAVVQEIGTANGITSVTYTMERIDISNGQRSKLVENVLALGVSADGKRAVYAKLAPQTGETLNASDVGVSASTVLVGLDQNLSPFNSPRYSPDGKTIAFASADQTGARADIRYVSAAPASDGAAALDGLPEDIWTIDAAGGTAQRVAELKEDLPALAWSGDGKHLYVVGAAGLYDVNLTNGAKTRLGDGSFHAQIAWAQ